jgi:ElaB/YqjD/DUF883 family membrane-anchored ribosome-binding protein
MTMLQDGKSLKIATPADLEGRATQFSELRADMAKLSSSVVDLAERRGRRIAADISDSVGEAVPYAARTRRNAEAEIERTVATHPDLALGLAAGFGLVIGAMTRR